MKNTFPHTDLTRPNAMRDLMRAPLCEFDTYAEEKGSRKALYRFIMDAPDSNGRACMVVGFGTRYKNPVHDLRFPDNKREYSHNCTVYKDGFKIVQRPKGTPTI